MRASSAWPAEGRGLRLLRAALPAALVAQALLLPLLLGAVQPAVYGPFVALALLAGLASWGLAHWDRAHGREVPKLPGRGLLLAFHALVAFQLVPLPPALLRLLSPGSFAFHDERLLLGLRAWEPVSVSPSDTLRGLLFLLAQTQVYALAFRELGREAWWRRLAGAVVAAGVASAALAFVQAARGDTLLWGFIQARWDWAVFGPYVNRNHFAGHLVLALPLALGLALEAAQRLGHARVARRGLLLVGEPETGRLLLHAALAAFLATGLLAARSRGALAGVALALGVALLASPRRRGLLLLAALVVVPAALAVGLGNLPASLSAEAARQSRLLAWADMLRLLPRFPLLGAGFNAFGTAYLPYQTLDKGDWWGEAHNEYLQVLLDTGIVGLALFAALLFRLAPAVARAARGSVPGLMLAAALLGMAVHNLVDFNWQIPANAASFVALLGAAVRAGVGARLTPSPGVPRID